MTIEASQSEQDILNLVRCLKPYGKIEIALNQSGKELSITLINPERIVVDSANIWVLRKNG